MILEKLHSTTSILESALQASAFKNDIISNNISNSEVPGFKKKSVEFDSILSEIVDNYKSTGVLNLSKAVPKITTPYKNFSQRLDGNNVDMELEMVELYKNSFKYDTLATLVINSYEGINSVLNAK